jgi:uncharacterized protein (TIGR02265 family)
VEQLVYENAVEGLFIKAFGKQLTPALKAAIKEVGIDLSQPLKTQYPGVVVNQATALLRKHLFGRESDDEKAYFLIGSGTLDGYFDTVLGRAMVSVLRIVGYERIIDRLPRQMASGSNYQFVEVKRVKPGEATVSCSDYQPHPALNLGVLTRAFTHYFPAPGFRMTIAEVLPERALYKLTWTV